MFFYIGVFGQKTREDSILLSKVDSARMITAQEIANVKETIHLFDKIIAKDSMYFELYLLRGLYMFLDRDTIYHDNRGLPVTIDTNIVNKAIDNFIFCINLKKNKHKKYPDTSLTNSILRFKCDTMPQTRDFGHTYMFAEQEDIFNGIRILLSDVDKDVNLACLIFRRNREKYKSVEKLIKLYCK